MIIAYFAKISWRRHREEEKIVQKNELKQEKRRKKFEGKFISWTRELEDEKCPLPSSFLDKIWFFVKITRENAAENWHEETQHKPPLSFPLSWEGGAGACRQNSCSMSRKSERIKQIDKH